MKIHIGEKQYKCNQCDEAFLHNMVHLSHMRGDHKYVANATRLFCIMVSFKDIIMWITLGRLIINAATVTNHSHKITGL